MGIEKRRRGSSRLGALLLMAFAAFVSGCKAARVQAGNGLHPEATGGDVSPVVLGLAVEGIRQHEAGDREAAIERYKAAVAVADARDPAKKANLLLLMAIDYLFLGRWEEAVEAAEQATAIRPNYAEAYYSLGLAYGNLGRFQEATGAFQHAIRLKPDSAAAYDGLGELNSSQGRFEDAIGLYQQAIELDPSVSRTHYFLGLAYGKVGRHQDEIFAYERAIRIKPDYVEAQFQLGLAYLASGRPAQALQPLRRTIRLKPDWAEAHFELGFALAQVDSWQEAAAAYQRAIKIKPDLAEAYLNLGTAYAKLGRVSESFEAGAEAYRLKPQLAQSLAAEFHGANGPRDPHEAVPFYDEQRKQAKYRGDADAEAAATLNLADAHDALGELADARAQLSEAVSFYRAAGNTQGEDVSWRWRRRADERLPVRRQPVCRGEPVGGQ
jgi:tetratricopeptide (TPR) repeat protein